MENPYPKDIFEWSNKEKLDFNRGRFNQHCFEIWENCKKKILEEIEDFPTHNLLWIKKEELLIKLKEEHA